jgi:autotransporter passenger strand-loop-strand repeat protein
LAGGTASGVTVLNGGVQYDYGSAISATFSGGLGYIFNGAVGSGLVLLAGATHEIFSGGTESGGTVSTGATEYDLGVVSGMSVIGGTLQVYNSATSTTIGTGGVEIVLVGATDNAGIVSSGGTQYISGTAIGDSVRGGTENVYGAASSTVVSTGYQVVEAGGTSLNTVLSSGGTEYVYGTASSMVVSTGGNEVVFSGGHLSGATIAGGRLELQNAVEAGSSTITFAGSGTLKLDVSSAFSGTIAGMATSAQMLDLADIAFGSGPTLGYAGNTLSGILTVSDGAHTATLALLGDYATANFHMANDGNGGTLVTDPPLAASPPSDHSLVTPAHG